MSHRVSRPKHREIQAQNSATCALPSTGLKQAHAEFHPFEKEREIWRQQGFLDKKDQFELLVYPRTTQPPLEKSA